MILDVHQMPNEGVGKMSKRPYRRAANMTDVTLNIQTPRPVQTLTLAVCTQFPALFHTEVYIPPTKRRRLASSFPRRGLKNFQTPRPSRSLLKPFSFRSI